MSQKLLIQCPNCNARLALPNSSQSEFAVGCPKCQLQFRVENPAPLPASPPPEKLERLQPVEESPSTLDRTTAVPENRPAAQGPAPVVQAETAKPARLVRAVPVDEPGSQSPSPSPKPPESFQQPHVGATQLPIDSKGNFKGSVTKRDLPNFDFEATNAKFELHANAPGSKSNSVDGSVQKAESEATASPEVTQSTEPKSEPAAGPTPPATERNNQVTSQEKQGTGPVTPDAKQEADEPGSAPVQAGSKHGSAASPMVNAASAPVKPTPQKDASQPSKDERKPSPDPGVTEAAKAQNAREESPEIELATGVRSAPELSGAQPEVAEAQPHVADPSSAPIAPIERLEPAGEDGAGTQAETSDPKTVPAVQPAQEAKPSAADSEKERLAKIAALVGKEEGTGRKGRRGKRGRRNKRKSAQVAKSSKAEVDTQAAAEMKKVSKGPPQLVLQETSETPGPKPRSRSQAKPTPPVEPQAEARVPEPEKEKLAQSQVVAESPSARSEESPGLKEEPATGTYSEQRTRKRLKKKPVKKGSAAAKKNLGSGKKDRLAAASAKDRKKEQEVRREPEQSDEQDWTSYHYLANRSNTSRKKRKAIVAGAVSFLALCFAIWAVIKADLFKELSRPDSSESGSEVAVETPVDSSHPFVNLYIKILQARIESLEQLSPTAEAMISYRQKNPVAGDIEYLLEKALAEEPAPREARKLILSDLSKLENAQEKLEADLLKAMSKGERRKWDKWLRTDSTEPKELVAELQLCFKSYRSDGLFSLPVPAQEEEAIWLSLEETQVVRNCLKNLVEVDSGKTANLVGTRLFKEADALFANAVKRTDAKKSSSEVPQSYKEFLFAAKMARNAVVNRLEREKLMTPALEASLERLDAAHEAFRLAAIGKSEAEVRAAFPNTASTVANAP